MKETRCSAAFCFTGTTDSVLFLSLYGRSKSQKAGGGGLRHQDIPEGSLACACHQTRHRQISRKKQLEPPKTPTQGNT